MRIIAGMSGGVDSSVTAYLLKEQGYEVEGVSFVLYEARMKNTFSGCCSIGAINDAQKTAGHIGIKHTVVDLREEFMERVIEPFIEAYSTGITPNPCILCNKYIKFPYLLKIADEKNAEHIATGHYARVTQRSKFKVQSSKFKISPLPPFSKGGAGGLIDTLLLKGLDTRKDQSYVLYVLRPEELKRLRLPLGEKRKEEVREIAVKLSLPAAKRPESQEICFIEDKNYVNLLKEFSDKSEGPMIDVETGKEIGIHKGVYLYTVGQRKRLGIATGKPLYVVRIDPLRNAVYVGPKEAAMMREFEVGNMNWLNPPDKSPHPPFTKGGLRGIISDREEGFSSFRATVKVRSTMRDEPAAVAALDENRARVIYDEPQWAPAPGQSAVFYDGDVVICGGVIQPDSVQNTDLP